jgi:hypothetical protein
VTVWYTFPRFGTFNNDKSGSEDNGWSEEVGAISAVKIFEGASQRQMFVHVSHDQLRQGSTNRKQISLDKDQGCQIFLGTKYQNGKKYTKSPRSIMSTKYDRRP